MYEIWFYHQIKRHVKFKISIVVACLFNRWFEHPVIGNRFVHVIIKKKIEDSLKHFAISFGRRRHFKSGTFESLERHLRNGFLFSQWNCSTWKNIWLWVGFNEIGLANHWSISIEEAERRGTSFIRRILSFQLQTMIAPQTHMIRLCGSAMRASLLGSCLSEPYSRGWAQGPRPKVDYLSFACSAPECILICASKWYFLWPIQMHGGK
jgi:hypothetical protein